MNVIEGELNVAMGEAALVIDAHEQVSGMVRKSLVCGVEIGDVQGTITLQQSPALSRRDIAGNAQAGFREEDFEDGGRIVVAIRAQAYRCRNLGAQARAHHPIEFAVLFRLLGGDHSHHSVLVANAET